MTKWRNVILLPCQLNIAIDGPAGAGKSSVARAVADALGLAYLDTGAMYRAVTWKALQSGRNIHDEDAIRQLAEAIQFEWKRDHDGLTLLVDGNVVPEGVRSEQVTSNVSLVASYEGVRSILRDRQRGLCASKGIVMDGRDIGTVVMPDADLKVFLTADLEERARRRLIEQGRSQDEIHVMMQSMAERDSKDSSRVHSPLKPASDALTVDTTGLSLQRVVDMILGHAQAVCAKELGE